MKTVQFLVDFFAVDGSGNSYVKYRQGQTYPLDEETGGQMVAGNAQEVQSDAVMQDAEPAPAVVSAAEELPAHDAEDAAPAA